MLYYFTEIKASLSVLLLSPCRLYSYYLEENQAYLYFPGPFLPLYEKWLTVVGNSSNSTKIERY